MPPMHALCIPQQFKYRCACHSLPFCTWRPCFGQEAAANGGLCILVRGQTHPDPTHHMGAAAVAVAQDGARVSRRAALGPAEDRQARDGALAALVLALEVLSSCPRATRACVFAPDRSSITALTSSPSHPLVYYSLKIWSSDSVERVHLPTQNST